jgi:peptide/nickel transport system permease protein
VLNFFFWRTIQSVVSLWVIVTIVFFAARLSGDPAEMLVGGEASREHIAALRAHYGLDRSVVVQYALFLRNTLAGDLGESIQFGRPVTEMLQSRLGASLQLMIGAMAFALASALPAGVYAAVYRHSWFDFAARSFAVLGAAMPAFWSGLMLMWLFGVYLNLLPIGGNQGLVSLILPSITLGWLISAGVLRLMRSSMMNVLEMEYVTLARIKGLSEWMVVWKHAFRNALLPVVTYSGILLGTLIGGAVVTEAVFTWPGLGTLLIQATSARDFPLIQGIVLLLGLVYIVINLSVDLLYGFLNPRISH